MKRNYLFIVSIIFVLFFAGCSINEPPAALQPGSLQESSVSRYSNPRNDATRVMGIGGRMYVDLAASETELYRLHENGNVMINRIRPTMTSIATLYRDYSAIDYVTDGNGQWGLIAASNDTKRIYIKGRDYTGIYGVYPSDVNYVYGIAGKQLDSNRLYIYIKVPNQYFASHTRMGIYDKRVSNVNNRITWDSTQYPYGAYANGLCEKDGKLLKWFAYTNKSCLVRWTAPDGSSQYENLGAYDCHSYDYGYQILSPRGFDYCPEDDNFYCLDNMGDSSQAIVRLPASAVTF